MVAILQPNVVVCPHCGKDFVHNKVNGMALLELSGSIDARKRMHCRLTLDAIERIFNGEIPRPIKKAIFDGYNDLSRDMQTMIGFGNEVE
jgi:hypothetical protein